MLAVGCVALFALDAALVGARVGWLVDSDRAVSRAAARAVHAHSWLLTAARVLTQFGNPAGVDVAAGGLALALLTRRHRRLAAAVVLARLLSLGIEQLVKTVVDRPRPVTVPSVASAGGSSFPSGHSTGAASIAAATALTVVLLAGARRRVSALIVVLAALACAVAASRVLLVVHYPSDVVGGLVLGLAAATASFAVLGTPQERGPTRVVAAGR